MKINMKNSLVFFIAAMLLINLQSGNAQTRGLVFGDVVWQILIPDNPEQLFRINRSEA